MNDLEFFIFKHKKLRTFTDDNYNVWFCLSDICNILDIGNPSQILTRLDKKEGVNTLIINEGIGNPSKNFINEPNLYRVIFQSRKKNAVDFQDWVFEQVLPSIRKKGFYATNEVLNEFKHLSNKLRNITNTIQLELFPEMIKNLPAQYKSKKSNISVKIDNETKNLFKIYCTKHNQSMRGTLKTFIKDLASMERAVKE